MSLIIIEADIMTDYTNTVAKSGNISIQVCEKPDDPPPSYSHRDALTDSVVVDGIMNYGSTATIIMEPGNSTQPLPSGQSSDLAQEYQEAVFLRFVCILFLFGCCVLFFIISASLDYVMAFTSGPDDISAFTTTMFIIGLVKGLLIFPSFVPLLSCCCCLGTRSPRCNFCCRIAFYISIAMIGSLLVIIMFSEIFLSWAIIEPVSSIVLRSTKGYAYALTCINLLAIIFSLVMTVTAIHA